ncbi:hypothetical protein KSF_086540 [Reticulibacter mediterranei]|uniref:Uncharacterized protein n=1 Tax=Reticulibacter mediterranei TaxID=2778369 RepID=A0A8J3IPY2_9CHLR|nr:hypothetical protein [Reticulibacter mediterranei]GHO98606.1 hypothetical protein KSF_086540 [Reticulibacter mediterranei]
MRSEEAPKRSRWTAPARDPLLELKWGLALLGEEGCTASLAWLTKHMKLLPSSDPPDPGGRARGSHPVAPPLEARSPLGYHLAQGDPKQVS